MAKGPPDGRRRLLQRGYKFHGRHAERDRSMFRLFQRGASLRALANVSGLTEARVWQIIARANGGTVRAYRY